MAQLEATIASLRAIVPELLASRHKGQAGKIAVIGGCREYTGAPYFAAISALKVGADLAHVFCSRDAASVIKSYSPELIVHPVLRESHDDTSPPSSPDDDPRVHAGVSAVLQWLPRVDCLVVGPGLGRDPLVQAAARRIVGHAREQGMPLVLDGDGLHLLTQFPQLVFGYPRALLTPNVNEFRRLQAAMRASAAAQSESGGGRSAGGGGGADGGVEAAAAAREAPWNEAGGASGAAAAVREVESAADLASLLGGVTVVQKGVADAISDGQASLQCSEFGSPRRCGGQGDVLAGSIAVFTAWACKWAQQQQQQQHQQQVPPPPSPPSPQASGQPPDGPSGAAPAADAAPGATVLAADASHGATVLAAMAGCLVVRHAAAAAFAAKKRSMTASDIIEHLGDSMEHFFPVSSHSTHPKM